LSDQTAESGPTTETVVRDGRETSQNGRNSRCVKLWSSVQVVADPRDEIDARNRTARRARPVGDLADEVERARTPRTPLRALTGVWLTVALTFAVSSPWWH
jgi:hypothetical protein